MATILGDLSTGLVSVWEMESGAIGIDSHGSNNLTDNNTVGEGTGKQGGCGDFELANSEHLSISDASQSGLDITGDLTLACWVKFESDVSTHIIGKRNGQLEATGRGYVLYKDGNTSTSLDINISDGSTATWKYVTWSPSLATWYHIAVVYTASAGSAKFYVNGAQQGATQTGLPTSIHNNSQRFTIGADADTSIPGGYMDGLIDQACVWAAALTDANISTLYNSGSGIAYSDGGGGPTVSNQYLTMVGIG